QKMGELRVHIFLYRQHFLRPPTGARRKHPADLRGPVMRREVSIHRIRIIWRKWILIGCDDHPRGWVERSRQLLERYESLPLEIARRAIHRQITQPPLPNRELAGGVVSDVPVHIGIDEIRAGSGESRQCRSEVLPV